MGSSVRAEGSTPPRLLSLLADPHRWRLIEELKRSDRRVQELTAALDQPANLVSYHLRKLREQALVRGRRSSADARDVYYSVDLDQLGRLYMESTRRIHPGLTATSNDPEGSRPERAERVRVLFLCTHNSARSQMAEGLLRQLGGDRFEVASAGTHPSRVNPLAIAAMTKHGIDISGHRSKSIDELAGEMFDYVVTVCDSANETCPVFPAAPERIHWSIQDPTTASVPEAERHLAFERAATELRTRIGYLIAIAKKGRPGLN